MTGTAVIDTASLLSHDPPDIPFEHASINVKDNGKEEVNVIKWKAFKVGCWKNEDDGIYTSTYEHIPPLAQEIPEEPEVPPTFRDPLRPLRLDVEETQSKTPSGSPQDGKKFPSMNSRFSDMLVIKIQKRFLRTPPNKYLPVPPLVRTPYF